MPKPRHTQISIEATPYYHCVSRCVRRAFLCGEDLQTGQSFEHRRQWIEDKLHELASIFAVELCAYAVMSNHYHVVLYVDKEEAESWSRQEVIEQWHRLFSGTLFSQRYLRGDKLGPAELRVLDKNVTQWRERLMDISWFMRCMNEAIARAANQEDNCTGRFWEGRFKSQALLDEAALAACMAYVDLNPIRARIAKTPEYSAHTSVKRRIEQAQTTQSPNHTGKQASGLWPFAGNPREGMPKGLPFKLTDYLELVDWSGRVIREDKPGYIDNTTPSILGRLNIKPEQWATLTTRFEKEFKTFVGHENSVRGICESMGYKRAPGIRACKAHLP